MSLHDASDVEDVRIGEIAAWVLRPTGRARSCVLMAHGFSMTRHDGLLPYARALRRAGHVVVVFDHRYLGDSGGLPRQRFRAAEQREDWHAVAAWAREHEPSAARTVLWGFSFNGGQVGRLSLEIPRVVAVIALCPFADGLARVLRTPPRVAASVLPRAAADLAGGHVTIPVTGPAGSPGALTFPGEEEGFAAAAAPGSPWRNEISPGLFLTVALHRPYRLASRIPVPLWVGIGKRDVTVSARAVRHLAAQAPLGELHAYDVDHFEPFYTESSRAIAADQASFLDRVIPDGER
jgi:alpha/beta superfamily hydrolase